MCELYCVKRDYLFTIEMKICINRLVDMKASKRKENMTLIFFL